MTAEELGRALIDTAKRRPLAAGEGSAMIQAAIEREQQVASVMLLGKTANALNFACQMWVAAKTPEWQEIWQRDIDLKKADLLRIIGGETDANS